MARSYMVKPNSKRYSDILNELKSANYNETVNVRGMKVWRFGSNDYATVEWVHPVYGYSEIWNNYGVHMTAEQMARKIEEG